MRIARNRYTGLGRFIWSTTRRPGVWSFGPRLDRRDPLDFWYRFGTDRTFVYISERLFWCTKKKKKPVTLSLWVRARKIIQNPFELSTRAHGIVRTAVGWTHSRTTLTIRLLLTRGPRTLPEIAYPPNTP